MIDSQFRSKVSALLLGQVSLQTRSALANARPLPGDVQVPVLCMTGVLDNDPYEFGSGPQQREAAWQAWPAGDKYLLMLSSGSHALLAGVGVNDPDAPVPFSREPTGSQGSGSPGRRGRNPGGVGAAGRDAARNKEPPPILDLRQIAAVQNISAAFLDAIVKSSPAARQWLDQRSRIWLGPAGTLSTR